MFPFAFNRLFSLNYKNILGMKIFIYALLFLMIFSIDKRSQGKWSFEYLMGIGGNKIFNLMDERAEKRKDLSASELQKKEIKEKEDEKQIRKEKSHTAWIKLKRFSTGRASFVSYQVLNILLIITIIACSLAAQSKFPVQYNMLDHHVSQQGGLINNPQGYVIWNSMMIVIGIMYIPYFLFVYKKAKKLNPRLSKIANIFSILACFGISFVGVFPEDFEVFHQVPAVFAMIGIFISANLYWLVLYNYTKKAVAWKQVLYHLCYTLLNCSFFIIVLTESIDFSSLIPVVDERWFNFQIWEWFFTIGIFSWIFLVSFFVPREDYTKIDLKLKRE